VPAPDGTPGTGGCVVVLLVVLVVADVVVLVVAVDVVGGVVDVEVVVVSVDVVDGVVVGPDDVRGELAGTVVLVDRAGLDVDVAIVGSAASPPSLQPARTIATSSASEARRASRRWWGITPT
jgi:hypothetical protein